MVMFLPGMWMSSARKAAAAKPANPPPTMYAFFFSIPSGALHYKTDH